MNDKYAKLLQLSTKEKLNIIDALWDSIDVMPNLFILTEEMKQELDRRHEEFLKNPESGMSWEQVKASILGKEKRST
jgi:putative addiction module component (TIGR02574 family)